MDPDLVVNDSLLDFYNTPLEGYWLAGCRDRLLDRERPEYRKFLGLRDETTYINSGVLLFHLTEIRKAFQAGSGRWMTDITGIQTFPMPGNILHIFLEQAERKSLQWSILWGKKALE